MDTLREDPNMLTDPHAGGPVLTAGPSPEKAAATVIYLHGRGASAQDILGLHQAIGLNDVAAIAPQAALHTWYPHSFLTPMEQNQPFLDSALKRVGTLLEYLNARGVLSERVALLGFSQGA